MHHDHDRHRRNEGWDSIYFGLAVLERRGFFPSLYPFGSCFESRSFCKSRKNNGLDEDSFILGRCIPHTTALFGPYSDLRPSDLIFMLSPTP